MPGAKDLKKTLSASLREGLLSHAVLIEGEKGTGRKKLAIAGGVAANSKIRSDFQREVKKLGVELYMPPLKLCGDNGAMIGAQAYYEYLAGVRAGQDLNAYATMPIDR